MSDEKTTEVVTGDSAQASQAEAAGRTADVTRLTRRLDHSVPDAAVKP